MNKIRTEEIKMSKQPLKQTIEDLNLPLQLTLDKASKISGIPIWTLRKYERTGVIPKGRRIGSRVYLNTRMFLTFLEIEE